MANKSLSIQPRDRQLLTQLLQSPFDAVQLWQLSQTFSQPFTDAHFVRRRLRRLRDAGLIAIYQYSTESTGVLNYYRLTQAGYHLACGPDKILPARSAFRPVSFALQRHVRHVASLLVKIRCSAQSAGVELPFLLGDNQVRLPVGKETLIPDVLFGLKQKGRSPQHYLVELDCGTEPVYSTKQRDSLRKKLSLYYAHEATSEGTYRVLFLFAEATPRVAHFLKLAREMAPDPRRHIVRAAVLDTVLGHADPLRWPLFLDHDRQLVSLLPCPEPAAAALVQESLLSESWFASTLGSPLLATPGLFR